ncbi:MAG: hypothetical protein OJF49_003551 [Ktedonobacterales bacterium]|nr:MAG: hypothetical protein OJF49_003551 [Ktedonobacterales bacterium]
MRLTVLERRMLALALIFGVLTLTLAFGNIATRRWGQTATAQAHATPWYGARTSWVGTATSEWPQRDANWCGPAAIEAAANYTYQLATNNQNNIPFNSGGQQRIANDLNSALATSIWGTPAWNGIGPGFNADIANDGGTDPRGMAWGIEYESAYGWYWRFLHNGGDPKLALHVPIYAFHNVIYHNDVTHAVGGLARTLEEYSQPVVVTVAHGLHFDVIAGVYSYNDPITSYPADVDAVDVWDPAVGSPSGGYQSAREVLWTNWTFNTDVHMWGSTYSSNSGYDPDPSVGIYTPNTDYPAHWIGYRTDFEIDHLINVLPDYAVDENLSVMQHP